MKALASITLLLTIMIPGVVLASAGLEWTDHEFTYRATPAETEVVAGFAFANAGDETITISRVETSCGCAVPQLEKKVYEPGENGKLEVLIKLGNLHGKQTLLANVYTDTGVEPSQTLQMLVDVPEVVRISSRQLHWYRGEPAKPKTIVVRYDHGAPVHIQKVTSPDAFVTAEFRALKPGREYEVSITPKTTFMRKRHIVPVTIVSDLPDENHRNEIVYAEIVPRRRVRALPVRLEPGMLVWEVGEPAEPKSMQVVVTGKKPLTLVPVAESHKTFTIELKTVEEGKLYELTLTPKDTSKTATEFLQFKIHYQSIPGRKVRPLKRPLVATAMIK